MCKVQLAVEFNDYNTAEGLESPKEYPRYVIK